MRKKNNEGSSLLEIVIAIAVLAAVVIPVCSSLVLSHKVNAKTEKLLQAQLEVSSVVETLMAKGIPENYHDLINTEVTALDAVTSEVALWWIYLPRDPDAADTAYYVEISERSEQDPPPYYNVKVTSKVDEGVVVETTIRVTPAVLPHDPGQGGGGNA